MRRGHGIDERLDVAVAAVVGFPVREPTMLAVQQSHVGRDGHESLGGLDPRQVIRVLLHQRGIVLVARIDDLVEKTISLEIDGARFRVPCSPASLRSPFIPQAVAHSQRKELDVRANWIWLGTEAIHQDDE